MIEINNQLVVRIIRIIFLSKQTEWEYEFSKIYGDIKNIPGIINHLDERSRDWNDVKNSERKNNFISFLKETYPELLI